MKKLYLIAIAFLASCTVTIAEEKPVAVYQETCPAVDPCPPVLLFHESQCSLYYECKEGHKITRNCATGLHFSKIWGGCVSPSKSECREHRPTCREGELTEHECICTLFYECKNGQLVVHSCPAGHHFNKYTQSCIEGENCREVTTTTTSTTTTSTSPSPRECWPEGDYIKHECNCTKYYVCKEGRKVLKNCPANWHFDENRKTCVEGPCNGKCEINTVKAHECRCEMYYRCNGLDWVVMTCPANLHFSPSRLECVPKSESGCGDQPGNCPHPAPSKWPHECDCRLYYQCVAGKKSIHFCPWGSYFDEYNLMCDAAANVAHCKNSWDDWV